MSGEKRELSMPAITELVAGYLAVQPASVDPDVSLNHYGLDSLASVSLVADLSRLARQDLPDFLLLDCPTVRSLHDYLHGDPAPVGSGNWPDAAVFERMRADADLPPDIRPVAPIRVDAARTDILLTGATGFLGSQLLATLLEDDDTRVVCLLREGRQGGDSRRMEALLRSRRLWPAARDRVTVIHGDLDQPRFGLSATEFKALGARIRTIYHCAAFVNWVLPYEALRTTNVLGTREILRLACIGAAIPVHFVSTIGVCLATPGPSQVSEDDDPFENLQGLHFGYVQSKCVAEELLRCAAQRGLPVHIYRPSLLSGDSLSGRSDTDGFLSRFLVGCVQMGCAPDLDWLVDCCPVDYIARCIVMLSRSSEMVRAGALHLVNPDARHWRETVLWMNLYGYRVRLLPFAEWVERMQVGARDSSHALHGLQHFFLLRPAAGRGLALPQLFEEGRKSDVRSDATAKLIGRLGLPSPRVDARLLDRYFGEYIATGQLRSPDHTEASSPVTDTGIEDLRKLVGKLQLTVDDEPLTVSDIVTISGAPVGESIITELSSWRFRNLRGLFPCRFTVRGPRSRDSRVVDVFIKSKPRDTEVIAIGATVADLCEAGLGDAVTRHADVLGFAGCHLRELGVYAQRDTRFRKFTPGCYGYVGDEADSQWVLALEYLSDVDLIDSANDTRGWTRDYLHAAIDGLAELHASWYRREDELTRQSWLGPYPAADSMNSAAELWDRLARFSGPLFSEWLGREATSLQSAFIDSLDRWWPELQEMPRTLIHQDLNPRNLAFRRDRSGPRLCVYDWELATLGVPQRDLAELLCFVLQPDCSGSLVEECLNRHRVALEQAAGKVIDAPEWRRGFELSLRELLINRLAMYTLIHRFRRQPFLQRTASTWSTLQRHFARPCRPRKMQGSGG